jgi:hypothetical protein
VTNKAALFVTRTKRWKVMVQEHTMRAATMRIDEEGPVHNALVLQAKEFLRRCVRGTLCAALRHHRRLLSAHLHRPRPLPSSRAGRALSFSFFSPTSISYAIQ